MAKSLMMDRDFFDFLRSQGISSATVLALEREDITNHSIFKLLSQSHLDGLLGKMKLGQHALLLNVWKKEHSLRRSHSVESQASTCSGSSTLGNINLNMSSPQNDQPYSPKPSSIVDDVKKLADMYRDRNRMEISSDKINKRKKAADPRFMTVILGAMIYDDNKRKGIKMRCIPEPNPRKVEMPKSSLLKDVFDKCNFLYFNSTCSYEDLRLADTNGMVIEVEEKFWVLDKYYEDNHYYASRHKLYVMRLNDKPMDEQEIFGSTSDDDPVSDSEYIQKGESSSNTTTTPYTKPVLKPCVHCGQEFYTYIPGTHCVMDDGDIMCHEEPMVMCPECDGQNGFAFAMNPNFAPRML